MNKFLAQKFIKLHEHKSQILSNRIDYMNDTNINNCTSEEADPRLLWHIIYQASVVLRNIMVKTVDTDVLILATAYCGKLISHGIDTFFVEFGSGSHTKYFNVVELFQFLGELRSTALPFFHSFSGCDTTSSFYLHGKCRFWDTWMNTSQEDILNTVFIELSNMPSEVSPTQVEVIKKYLIEVCYPQEKITSLTELRLKYFFKSSDPKLRSLIISNDGLINHIKPSALQAGWLWKQCEHNVVCPDPTKWGWNRSDNKCTAKWCNEYKNIK